MSAGSHLPHADSPAARLRGPEAMSHVGEPVVSDRAQPHIWPATIRPHPWSTPRRWDILGHFGTRDVFGSDNGTAPTEFAMPSRFVLSPIARLAPSARRHACRITGRPCAPERPGAHGFRKHRENVRKEARKNAQWGRICASPFARLSTQSRTVCTPPRFAAPLVGAASAGGRGATPPTTRRRAGRSPAARSRRRGAPGASPG